MKHLQSIDIEIDIIVVSSLVFSLLEKKKDFNEIKDASRKNVVSH